MAGPAFHEQPDDGFGFGSMLRLFWSEWVGTLGSQKRSQRHPGQSAARAGKKFTPRGDRPVMGQFVQHNQFTYKNSFEFTSIWHRSASAAFCASSAGMRALSMAL